MHLERWQVKKNKELQDPDGSLDYFPLKKTQLSVTMANGDGDRYVPDEPGASWARKQMRSSEKDPRANLRDSY